MQGLAGVDPSEFRAAGQQPLMKIEILVGGIWKNLNDLDGKNYVQDISISLGGATMTPQPIEGVWSATIFNKDGVFHPKHPTSGYEDYLRTERLTKISIGAIYGGVPKYWPRIIGFMNEPKFNASESSVIISGGDYMKRLEETEIKFPDNYWGALAGPELFDSIASDGVISGELYDEADAMTIEPNEVNDIPVTWVRENCLFNSFADNRPGSAGTKCGRVTGQGPDRPVNIRNLDVVPGAIVAGTSYQVKFWHLKVGGPVTYGIRVMIKQDAGDCFSQIYYPTDAWKEETFEFTARDNTAIQWWFKMSPVACQIRLDDFSIRGFKFYYDRYYDITDANEKGPYRVTLDTGGGAGFEDVWQAEEDEGWWYEEATGHVFFDINKVVASRANSVRIYYFMTTPIEKILADLLFQAGVPDVNGDLYANAAALLAVIEDPATGYIDPAINIDKAWFEPGTNCLDAVKKICERCNYRFYFRYDGTPIFRPKPGAHVADFTLTHPKHAETIETYQSKNEIKNRIVIEGLKQTSHINREETVSSQYKGELADDGAGSSIELYGERTRTIKNHLFQDQDSIDHPVTGMCKILLDEYKDPKWYADLKIPFNPVPLEFGDNLKWEERLSPILNIVPSPEGIIRDIKIDNYNTTYKCEKK